MKKTAILLILSVTVAVLATGCASVGKKKGDHWNSQVGKAKYKDVVSELGPPNSKETLSDGAVVAKWVRSYAGWSANDPQITAPGSSIWTDELIMTFSSDGTLTKSVLLEY